MAIKPPQVIYGGADHHIKQLVLQVNRFLANITNLLNNIAENGTGYDISGVTIKNGVITGIATGVVNWTDIIGKPTAFTPTTHTHEEIDRKVYMGVY